MNKVRSNNELDQMIDRLYELCKVDNEEKIKRWVKSRNWVSFESMGFDVGEKQIMNIKGKLRDNVHFTYPKNNYKDKRITGTTRKGFMPNGSTYQTKGKTEDEIYEKVTKEYMRQMKEASRVYLSDILDEAIAYKQKRSGNKNETIKQNRNQYENYVRGTKLERIPMEQIRFVDIEDYMLDEMLPKFEALHEGRRATAKERRNNCTMLKYLFYYAHRKGYITENVYESDTFQLKGRLANPKRKKPEDAIFSDEELQDIIDKCMTTYKGKNHCSSHIAIILTSLTGLRVGEVSALKWSDCNLKAEHPYLDVERAEDNEGVITEVKCDSDAGRRRVPLPPQAVEVLKMLRADSKVLTEWVFTQDDGTRRTKKQIENALHRTQETLRFEKIKGMHALRRTYCSKLIASGMPITTVQRIMGHKDAETTMKHYAFDASKANEVSQIVNETFTCAVNL